MSQAVLAERLGVSGAAVNKLERAELHGGVTIGKLSEVAGALDCSLVYAFVPNSTLERTVRAQARAAAAQLSQYAARTMALEAQDVDDDRQGEAVERYAQQLVTSGNPWRAGRQRPDTTSEGGLT